LNLTGNGAAAGPPRFVISGFESRMYKKAACSNGSRTL
jgi:hypothetical protein